ncbi:hypothetical protein D9M71_827820 [compost metagenome]
MMLGRAIGSSDEHSSDLRIGTDFVFEHGQIEAVGIEAALDGYLHVRHQRRTFGQLAATLQKHRQCHPRCQRRHFT